MSRVYPKQTANGEVGFVVDEYECERGCQSGLKASSG